MEDELKVNEESDKNKLNTEKYSNKNDSLALFFDKPREGNISYRSYVNNRFLESPKAGPVLRLRNILIVLTIIEIFASIWGFAYYFIRKSMIYIVVNTSALLLSIIGVYSTIAINEIGLICYALVNKVYYN